MLAAVIAFFVATGAVSLYAAKRLVGVRGLPAHPLAETSVDPVVGDEELKRLLTGLVRDVRELRDVSAELQTDVQQIREMVLGDRLTSRRAVERTAKYAAELQRDIAEFETRVRRLESDSGAERALALRDWVSSRQRAAAAA